MIQEILWCPKCGEAMIQKNQDYWKCPKCEGEWWPDENKLAYLEEERRAREHEEQMRMVSRYALCSASYKPVMPYGYVPGTGKGSGSKSAGRRKKKPQKPLASEQHLVLN